MANITSAQSFITHIPGAQSFARVPESTRNFFDRYFQHGFYIPTTSDTGSSAMPFRHFRVIGSIQMNRWDIVLEHPAYADPQAMKARCRSDLGMSGPLDVFIFSVVEQFVRQNISNEEMLAFARTAVQNPNLAVGQAREAQREFGRFKKNYAGLLKKYERA